MGLLEWWMSLYVQQILLRGLSVEEAAKDVMLPKPLPRTAKIGIICFGKVSYGPSSLPRINQLV